MMRFLTILVLVTLTTGSSAIAQGFDWQTSPRMPMTIPKRYVGLEIGSGYTFHGGSLEYIEEDLGLTCCDYTTGSGLPLTIAVMGEQWISAFTAVHVSLGFQQFRASFTTPSEPVPLRDGSILRTEYLLEGAISYVTLDGGIATRVLGSQLTVGGGLRVLLYAGGSLDQTERVVSPDDYQFTGNPRSRERSLGNTFLESATAVQLEPYVQLGYNIPLTYGFYLTPSVLVGLPLLNVTGRDEWRMVDLGVRLRLMRGL
jgi:hypothetical protein